MPDQNPAQNNKKRRLSNKTRATNLWTPDERLFHEIVRKRRCKPAQLLREIVHHWCGQWCATHGLVRDTEDVSRELALIDFQRQTNATIEAVRKELSASLKQLIDAVSSPEQSGNGIEE
jgi:hypothetical protein